MNSKLVGFYQANGFLFTPALTYLTKTRMGVSAQESWPIWTLNLKGRSGSKNIELSSLCRTPVHWNWKCTKYHKDIFPKKKVLPLLVLTTAIIYFVIALILCRLWAGRTPKNTDFNYSSYMCKPYLLFLVTVDVLQNAQFRIGVIHCQRHNGPKGGVFSANQLLLLILTKQQPSLEPPTRFHLFKIKKINDDLLSKV